MGDLPDLGQVDPLSDEPGTLPGAGFVAVEPVAAEGEGQRDLVGGQVYGGCGDPVVAGRQLGRQGSKGHGIAPLPQAEQHPVEPAAGVGDHQHLPGLGLELMELGKALQEGRAAGEGVGEVARQEGVDRDCRVVGGVLDHVAHQPSAPALLCLTLPLSAGGHGRPKSPEP